MQAPEPAGIDWMTTQTTAARSRPRKNGAGARIEIDAAAMRRNADAAARLLKTLANDQRLRVLCFLFDEELSVGEINERVELSQSALSQHLAKLRAEGIVTTRRDAQTIYYSLADGAVREIIATLHDIYLHGAGRKNTTPR
jgi:DNA-binding transcriptional ArsR family regulator